MKVSVVGSGAWGTALAIRLHKNGHDVTMWTFEKDLIEEMETTRRNPRLPAIVPFRFVVVLAFSAMSLLTLLSSAPEVFPRIRLL